MEKNGRTTSRQGVENPAAPPGGEAVPDSELLTRYVAHQPDPAFDALIRRYGPLVLGVCQRVLRDHHAAEDAFQATFLALALQGRSLKQDRPLGSWLYTVAFRTARKIKLAAGRRRATERQVGDMAAARPEDEVAQNELRAVVDEELHQLQERYRAVLVLVYLEGKPHQQVAAELGWPSGSVSRRVARARELLRQRLARRGIVLSTALLLTILAKATAGVMVPPGLVAATLKAAALGVAGATAASAASGTTAAGMARECLAQGLRLPRLSLTAKVVLGVVLLAGLGIGAGMAVHDGWGRRSAPGAGVPASYLADARRCGPCAGSGWLAHETLLGKEGPILALAFLPGERLWAAAAGSGKAPLLKVWDTAAGNGARALAGGAGPFPAAAFSPDASLLAAAAEDKTVRVWDVAAGAARYTIRGLESRTEALAFAPDGALLAGAGADGSIRLWDSTTGKPRTALDGGMGPVSALGFSPDGSLLAAGGQGGTVKTWDVATQKQGAQTHAHTDRVSALVFAPDGSTLVTASWDQTLRSWDTGLRRKLTFAGHTDRVCCAAFAPGGIFLVSGGRDRTLRIWNLSTGQQLAVLQGHAGAVEVAAFHWDGARLATGSPDGTVLVWKQARRGRAPMH